MASFRYVAIDKTGRTIRGAMEAADAAGVVAALQRQGQMPVRAEPDAGGHFWANLLRMDIGRKGLSRQEVANFTRELSIMLEAGQDLDRALRFLAETGPNKRVCALTSRLRDRVRNGGALTAALADHPGSFSRLYVGLVRAGEAGGTLAATLERMALLLERERSLVAAVQSALVYPVLLVIAAIGSITLLLTEVLPQFVPLFEQSGAKLPAATQILITAGDIVSRYGFAMLFCGLAGWAVLYQVLRRPGPRLAKDRLLLRLPILGTLGREVLAARFSRTLGTLVSNGVPLVAALGIVREAVVNLAGAAAVDRATLSAKSGAGLARSLEASGVFPVRTVHLLRLGEETGQLGAMALRAAEIHEEKARLGIQRLVALLVPAITIVMGTAVAGIVSALLLAMLGLNDLAQ
jgi:general secretion pathway protein F